MLKQMIKPLSLAAVMTALVACSSNDDVELMPAELVDFDETVELDVVWSDDIGKGSGERYMLLTPARYGDQIFATDANGQVLAYQRDNGKEQWETELDVNVTGGVGAGPNHVFVGTQQGQLIALNSADGTEAWRAQVSSEILTPPQANRRVVVAQTSDGKLYGFDSNDGRQLWLFDNVLPALTLRGTGTPLVTETVVYAGFASGKIAALSPTDGIVMWEQRVAAPQGRSELDRIVDIDGAPLLIGDTVFSASYQGRLVAINRNNGRGLWAQEESTYTNLAAGLGHVYIVTDEGLVRAYSATNGELVWENDQLQRRRLNAPQTFGDYVAVADFEGYLHVMDQTTGQFVARSKVDGDGVRAPMLSAGNTLYVQGNSGDLKAITVEQ